MSDLIPTSMPGDGEFLFYQSDDGRIRLQVRLEAESVWLTQAQLSELFQRERSVITKHIRNIFEETELEEQAVCANFARTAADGKTYQVEFYNLDVIISVGYRVKSQRGTQFRIWATQRLREYIVKGFTMDDERLKQRGGGNYFEELLARIRDIRSSEKEFWRKVLEIYATSIDYDPSVEASRQSLTCDFAPAQTLARPVNLNEIKADPRFATLGLVRQPRLAVMPVTKEQFGVLAEGR